MSKPIQIGTLITIDPNTSELINSQPIFKEPQSKTQNLSNAELQSFISFVAVGLKEYIDKKQINPRSREESKQGVNKQ